MTDGRAGPLAGRRVTLRPLAPADVADVRRWLREPGVAAWWDQGLGDGWVDELLGDDDLVGLWVVVADGEDVGFVQAWEEPDPGYRTAGLDLFLLERAQGRGLGGDVVHAVCRWLVDVRGHHRLEIDPAADNARAIACYRSVGFRDVGVLRRRERTPDGWRDVLQMDLLADELVHPDDRRPDDPRPDDRDR